MKKQLFVLTLLVAMLLMATALPALATGYSFGNPIHGPGDLVPPKNPPYGHHPIACFPPLVLDKNGQCTLPGDNTPPSPIQYRAGF